VICDACQWPVLALCFYFNKQTTTHIDIKVNYSDKDIEQKDKLRTQRVQN